MLILLLALNLYAFSEAKPIKKETRTEHKKTQSLTNKKTSPSISDTKITGTPALQSKIERTFAIIKPDAVSAGHTGEIIKLLELNKFNIIRMRKVQLTKKQAETFYKIHKDKEFFPELIKYIISGPVIVLGLERENSVKEWRNLMGATNPEKASVGTIRKMFGKSITYNSVHGSDSIENAQIELQFFFPDLQYN
jgi:nucleoside-diphosphate kinase